MLITSATTVFVDIAKATVKLAFIDVTNDVPLAGADAMSRVHLKLSIFLFDREFRKLGR